ncbi:hypothetical protein WA026_000626 [Henosepilachna vigintioctopunctata]|uniref:UDP-glucuronosyltransferase n=1 Tax=Henosepilachna vigintioctopunctata TaxID=420089 RepID=A0AAW1V8X2_9CUCU
MRACIILSLVLILPLERVENAKILSVLPLPTVSHFIMFRRLFEELTLRGHEVDVVTPFRESRKVPGLNIIPIEMPAIYEKFSTFTMEILRSLSVHSLMPMQFADHVNLCEVCFAPDAMKNIRDGGPKYDLIILEIFSLDCLFGYAHALQTPVVSITSSVDLPFGSSRIGNPDNPAYISNYFGTAVPNMSLLERLHNVFTVVQVKLMHFWILQEQEKEAKKFFGEDLPPLNEIIANSSLLLVNSHFSSNQARPTVPNFIEVGGLHIDEPKSLEKQFSDFIGNSSFIYFGLGTYASAETLPIQKLQNICNVLEELNHKVIWKVDAKKLPKNLIVPKNIFIVKWVPQLDILCHPNILFFITHNGLMGTQEAVYCGVPMLSIPTFSDQFLNAKTMVKKGLALELNLEYLTKQEVQLKMRELIENPKFKENAARLSQQFKDRPRKPLDEAVYWIEYVLRHKGAPQLQSDAINLYWYQYYLLDVLVIILSLMSILLGTVYIIIRKLINISFRKNTKDKVL